MRSTFDVLYNLLNNRFLKEGKSTMGNDLETIYCLLVAFLSL